jgi:hypothetical protein
MAGWAGMASTGTTLMPTYRLHTRDQVYVIHGSSQAEAVCAWEIAHPGQGGQIVKVEPLPEPEQDPDR